MVTDGLAIVERKAREHIPSDLMPHREEILAFSQVLFQQSIPDVLRTYDIARLRNNCPDSGYGTLSEAGAGGHSDSERMGVSVEDTQVQGSPSQHVTNADQSNTGNSQQLNGYETSIIDFEGVQMYAPGQYPTWPTTDPNMNWEISNALDDLLDNRGTGASFDYL
ncbi:hypothetical protein F4818DRAFT_423870 [Hypoxylon cercidicola]|nr:hypothetical protein F4818DRAFT_423870 [Hypoxylon cercidicola]